jgi:ParB-like chromosome segregation protein Spo0J
VVQVPLADLTAHPRNPRQGDVGAVVESIEANGFYGALVVQRSSGNVLAGNHRLAAAVALGIEKLPVLYLDVDDEAALRILLADNRTSDLATYDDRALAALLSELATVGGLIGTGYDGDALDELLKDLAETDFTPDDPDRKMTCPACGHQWALG